MPGISGCRASLLPGIQATCGAENLCHQAIIAGDATHAVMPPDPEMLTAALLLLAAGRALRQAAGNQRAGGESRADMRSSAVGTSQ